MSDPIARADQAVEEIKGLARIHAAYYTQLRVSGMDEEDALATLHQFMWIGATQNECDTECDCEDD